MKRYFDSRIGVSLGGKINLDGVNFKNISETDNDLLCNKITELEVLEVVGQCGSSKSHGPDGFNFFFIKKNWDIIGKEHYKKWLFRDQYLATK